MTQTTSPRAAASRDDQPPTVRGIWSVQWRSPVMSYYLMGGSTILLLVLGLAMVLSSSSVDALQNGDSAYSVFLNQAKFALMGLPFMILAMFLRPSFYKRIAWPALFVAIALQLLIFTPLAYGANGNTNWVRLSSSVMIQPSELAKVALALWLGVVLGRKLSLLTSWKHAFVPAVPVAGLVVLLVLAGNDLGTALILLLLVAGAMFVAGVPMRMFAVAGLVGIAGVVALVLTSQNRVMRIMATYGADCDKQNECYQAARGLEALGTGGLTGVGLGAGFEKWSYLPEAHNDYIFAVLGEELGLPGTLLVLLLFGLLGLSMVRVVRRHPDPMVKITTSALACWIVGQALVNIGVVIGLFPVIGVPLPLVSAGGSALVATMLGLGMALSFARDEPGAREALSARPSVVRRSIAVVGGAARGRRGRAGRADVSTEREGSRG
jgi:cell division protein FtsW